MRRLLPALLAVTFIVMWTAQIAEGQDPTASTVNNPLFNPHVETIWHKTGIAQGIGRFKKFRETRVNRKGNRPEREKKLKLKPITAPENLAEGAPEALKAAAQIKLAEELAPQKIKALKYLGTIGCGCYNKKNADLVEGALLESLDDCTPAVRKEALNVIMMQVQSGGCNQCACSCVTTCGPSCNSKSCCSPKIYKKLEELANKTDKSGCPAETDPSIKALALQVLNACPMPPAEEPA